jgi:protein-tyrosine phosphatase
MVSVCFVCLGNICRSPTAEGVFRHLVAKAGLDGAIRIDSAGTAGYHSGDPPDSRSRDAASRRGIVVDGCARQFKAADFSRFDYVLAMDGSNLADLEDLRPDTAQGTLRLLRSFDPTAPEGASVPDPYYGGASGFDEVLDQCLRACQGLLDHIRREHRL